MTDSPELSYLQRSRWLIFPVIFAECDKPNREEKGTEFSLHELISFNIELLLTLLIPGGPTMCSILTEQTNLLCS